MLQSPSKKQRTLPPQRSCTSYAALRAALREKLLANPEPAIGPEDPRPKVFGAEKATRYDSVPAGVQFVGGPESVKYPSPFVTPVLAKHPRMLPYEVWCHRPDLSEASYGNGACHAFVGVHTGKEGLVFFDDRNRSITCTAPPTHGDGKLRIGGLYTGEPTKDPLSDELKKALLKSVFDCEKGDHTAIDEAVEGWTFKDFGGPRPGLFVEKARESMNCLVFYYEKPSESSGKEIFIEMVVLLPIVSGDVARFLFSYGATFPVNEKEVKASGPLIVNTTTVPAFFYHDGEFCALRMHGFLTQLEKMKLTPGASVGSRLLRKKYKISFTDSLPSSEFFTHDLDNLTFAVHPSIKSVCDQLTPPTVQRNFDGSTDAARAFWLTAAKSKTLAESWVDANKSTHCKRFGAPLSLNYDKNRVETFATDLKKLVDLNHEEPRELIYGRIREVLGTPNPSSVHYSWLWDLLGSVDSNKTPKEGVEFALLDDPLLLRVTFSQTGNGSAPQRWCNYLIHGLFESASKKPTGGHVPSARSITQPAYLIATLMGLWVALKDAEPSEAVKYVTTLLQLCFHVLLDGPIQLEEGVATGNFAEDVVARLQVAFLTHEGVPEISPKGRLEALSMLLHALLW